MPLGDTYSGGNISASATATDPHLVAGTGTNWTDVVVGDSLWTLDGRKFPIASVNDTFDGITLQIPWYGADAVHASYLIIKDGWSRTFVGDFAKRLTKFVSDVAGAGAFVFVDGDEPDVEDGENGQWAVKTNAPPLVQFWVKVAGAWTYQGELSLLGFGNDQPWSSITNYAAGRLVTKNGSTWYATAPSLNQDPEAPGSTYWTLFARGVTDDFVTTMTGLLVSTTAQASAAATSATSAAASASTATTEAGIATTKAAAAAVSEMNAGTSAATASGAATSATTQATSATASAATATTQAGIATSKAADAAASATTAATARDTALTYKNDAATSAGSVTTAAATAASEAAAATAAAVLAEGYAAILGSPDYGFFSDTITDTRDYGSFV